MCRDKCDLVLSILYCSAKVLFTLNAWQCEKGSKRNDLFEYGTKIKLFF